MYAPPTLDVNMVKTTSVTELREDLARVIKQASEDL